MNPFSPLNWQNKEEDVNYKVTARDFNFFIDNIYFLEESNIYFLIFLNTHTEFQAVQNVIFN